MELERITLTSQRFCVSSTNKETVYWNRIMHKEGLSNVSYCWHPVYYDTQKSKSMNVFTHLLFMFHLAVWGRKTFSLNWCPSVVCHHSTNHSLWPMFSVSFLQILWEFFNLPFLIWCISLGSHGAFLFSFTFFKIFRIEIVQLDIVL